MTERYSSGQASRHGGQRLTWLGCQDAGRITEKEQANDFLVLTVNAQYFIGLRQLDDLPAAPLHPHSLGPRGELDILDGTGDSGVVLALLRGRAAQVLANRHVLAAGEADAVAFGVPFIANPDLPRRFELDAPLDAPHPETFYAPGPQGYTDYPVLEIAERTGRDGP